MIDTYAAFRRFERLLDPPDRRSYRHSPEYEVVAVIVYRRDSQKVLTIKPDDKQITGQQSLPEN
ncbi:MAG: hypothetical protein HY513_02450 [Candidatus Aenigmarchaeota archaeon]|nr:hypothetical protein [Candidatus Aenigmarchaeota archaeon]